MHHLPAYVALERWAATRRVVVVAPSDGDGLRRLLAAGARSVTVVGGSMSPVAGTESYEGVPHLPVTDASVDMVLCVEAYASLSSNDRQELLREAYRVLRPGGLLAAWIRHPPGPDDRVDFWTLEEELAGIYQSTYMLAQMPWHGFSLAPVLDAESEASPPTLTLDEGLLRDVPEASHYLAIAFRQQAPTHLVERLKAECLLVPVPEAPDEELDALRVELDELRPQAVALQAELRTKSTDLTVLTTTVNDLEQSLARMSERMQVRSRELETRATAYDELQQRHDDLAADRDGLTHQVEVVIAEREGARQLAARIEAEHETLRRRHGEQQERLADKVQEASRLSGELQALRERLQHQEAMLDQSRSRAEELTANAAKGYEQGRMLTEVAGDRDRLREELTRRAAEIDKLEERLWEAREEIQKERLDEVRLSGELERLREQAERAHQAEQGRERELSQLAVELRRLEVERADAHGLLRSREEEIVRLRSDLEAMSGESDDVASLRKDLQERGRELAERSEELAQARAREQDALTQAKRRDAQLSDAGAQLEQMRRSSDDLSGLSVSLQSELDVKSLESEQLAASVADLQGQVEELRRARREALAEAEQVQRRLEVDAAAQEALRRRLRTREQELEDLVSANETSGVELYKLRRELEATAQVNEDLEEALRLEPGVEEGPTLLQEQQWPEEAITELRRLKGMLAERARQHAEQLARVDALAISSEGGTDVERARQRRLELEVSVRAEEQEHLLRLLEGAEQKIWEMSDESDRNAARLAAGLAQLEKHKEQIDELHDELEVGRNLLAAAQARSLEQERLLASERHKLARAGIGPDGLLPSPRNGDSDQEVDDLFAELDMGTEPLLKLDSSTQEEPKVDVGGSVSSVSSPIASRSNTRMVIETMDEDTDWPEPPAALEEVGPRVTLVRRSADDADPEGNRGGG